MIRDSGLLFWATLYNRLVEEMVGDTDKCSSDQMYMRLNIPPER